MNRGGDKNPDKNRKRPGAKPAHGSPNPIMLSEQRAILATVDRALASSGNAQVIGRNGEIPLRQFFNRYLPFTLRAATGHFVSPAGRLSPQIDLLLLDARYPLLAENPDGSVLAMLHAVVAATEVKTRLTTRDVRRGWKSACSIMEISNDVKGYGKPSGFSSVHTEAIAYRVAQSLETTETAYVEAATPDCAGFDVYVLSVPDADQPRGSLLGAELHMEPIGGKGRFVPTFRLSHTLLADIYYRLVQDAYYTLSERNWSHGDIGRHVMEYMAWATCSWNEYAALMKR
jgi:uncharacterized protein DUF6602